MIEIFLQPIPVAFLFPRESLAAAQGWPDPPWAGLGFRPAVTDTCRIDFLKMTYLSSERGLSMWALWSGCVQRFSLGDFSCLQSCLLSYGFLSQATSANPFSPARPLFARSPPASPLKLCSSPNWWSIKPTVWNGTPPRQCLTNLMFFSENFRGIIPLFIERDLLKKPALGLVVV